MMCATVNCQNVFYILLQIISRNIQQDVGKPTNKNKNNIILCHDIGI